MTTLATWTMLLAIGAYLGWLLYEMAHADSAPTSEERYADFDAIERTDLLIWDGETRGEWP